MLEKMLEKLLQAVYKSKIFQWLDEVPWLHPFLELCKNQEWVIHIIKYLIVGVLTTVISLGTLWITLQYTAWNENLCNFVSIVMGILTAYELNRSYVFESQETNWIKEFSKFVMARAASSVFDLVTFFLLATCLQWNEMFVKVMISIVVIILNYILSKWFVFQKGKQDE